MKTLAVLVAASALAFLGCATGDASSDETPPPPATNPQTGEDDFTASKSKHAIVLAHGFDGSLTNRWSFYKVKDERYTTYLSLPHRR